MVLRDFSFDNVVSVDLDSTTLSFVFSSLLSCDFIFTDCKVSGQLQSSHVMESCLKRKYFIVIYQNFNHLVWNLSILNREMEVKDTKNLVMFQDSLF